MSATSNHNLPSAHFFSVGVLISVALQLDRSDLQSTYYSHGTLFYPGYGFSFAGATRTDIPRGGVLRVHMYGDSNVCVRACVRARCGGRGLHYETLTRITNERASA